MAVKVMSDFPSLSPNFIFRFCYYENRIGRGLLPILMASADAESQFSTALLWDYDDGDEDVSEQRNVLRAGVSSPFEEVSPIKCAVRESATRLTITFLCR